MRRQDVKVKIPKKGELYLSLDPRDKRRVVRVLGIVRQPRTKVVIQTVSVGGKEPKRAPRVEVGLVLFARRFEIYPSGALVRDTDPGVAAGGVS